jgi:hypothetical protein
MLSDRPHFKFIAIFALIWLLSAFVARVEFLPYDVRNTDVGTYLFQSETFAGGRLTRESPRPVEFFSQWQAIVRDKSYAYYPPVPALMMAPAVAVGLSAWIGPWLLSGASILLFYFWARLAVGEATAVIGSCLLAVSPFFNANATAALSHSPALLLTLAMLLSGELWRKKRSPWFAILAGLFLGLLFASRPLNAAALGAIWFPWMIWVSRRSRTGVNTPMELPLAIRFAIGFGLIFVLLLLYHRLLAGRWTLELFTDYWPRNRWGFGENLGRGEPGHFFQTFARHDVASLLEGLKYSLLGFSDWWTGSRWISWILFAVIAVVLVVFRKHWKEHPWLVLVLLWIPLHVLLYAFYFTQSTPPTGPRYTYELLPAFSILAAWALAGLATRWEVSLKTLSLILFAGFVAASVWKRTDFYRTNAREIPPRKMLEECVRQQAVTPAIVFIRSFWIGHPYPIFRNPPGMKAPVLFATDRGHENQKLMELHQDRNAYVLAVDPRSPTSPCELIPIYEAASKRWLMEPGAIKAPFYIGGGFTPPLQLSGEEFRRLFHPLPSEIRGQ